jgi:cytidyltransferase-like protein
MVINPYPSVALESATLYIKAHPELRVGLTSGSFDLFHDFHLRFLLRCRRHCDILVVGVDSDADVRASKGLGRPFQSEYQRQMVIDAIKHTTFAYIQNGLQDLQRVAEALLNVHGGSIFKNQDFLGHETEVMAALGTAADKSKLVIIPDIEELGSTSALAERIRRTEDGPRGTVVRQIA